ncbi:MAG: dockerin type I domain-containing protein, partial [Saprospiraceae bacterium]
RMVQLRVTDEGGNTNICMVSVQVQDKVVPSITCQPDITIRDCNFVFDPSNPGAYFGVIAPIDNCPANNPLSDVIVDGRTQCGIGPVMRTTSVPGGNTCVQKITFINEKPFYINDANPLDATDDVIWPLDYTATAQCSVLGLDTSVTGRPKIVEDKCDLVGMNYKDELYPFTTNGACFKIIRTWSIIDWCQKDANNLPRTWKYEQEIKVMDKNAPELILPTSPVIFETLDCKKAKLSLTAMALDCTPSKDMRWSYAITHLNTITSKLDTIKQGVGVGNDTTNIFTVVDSFAIGVYTIHFVAEDRCGNVTRGQYNFELLSRKAPIAVCMEGLSAPLVLMNGVPMVMLNPTLFDNKSSHPCGYDIRLSFSSKVDSTLITFDCSHVGRQPIELWVTDTKGNQSFCKTFIDITSGGLCLQPPAGKVNVSGLTTKESGEVIEGVKIEMKGSELTPALTDKTGKYSFAQMSTGGNYEVIPSKSGDDLNGVSTLDIVMIQRHVLGLEKFINPYQLIAADVNNNGSITAADLTEMRKLVLGLIPGFTNNTSWRFIDSEYKFVNNLDPWLTPYAEKYLINGLDKNMAVNFKGMKIGDVNGSAKGTNASDNSIENRSKYSIAIDDEHVSRGQIITVPVVAETTSMVYGLQTQWQTNGLIIRDIQEGALKIGAQEFIIGSIDQLSMSHVSASGSTVKSNEVLYMIEVEVLKSGRLSEMLSLGSNVSAEVYTEGMETKGLSIHWRNKVVKAFTLNNITPNPWNIATSISFELPSDGRVSFKVMDYTGRKLVNTVDSYRAGSNTIQVTKNDIGQPGVYVYELRYGEEVITGRMILIE